MTNRYFSFRASTEPSNFDPAVCRNCQETLTRRGYATATAESTSAATQTPTPPETSAAGLQTKYNIKAGLVISRAPRITRELTPFEKAYFFYQRRLNERLALPFTRYFYYKRGTTGDVEWKRKIKDRQTPARDIGRYNAYSEDAWNDELLVGASESEPDNQVAALLRDVETTGSTETEDSNKKEEVEKPLSRATEADKNDDDKSLDRLLPRTLYLLVQSKEGGQWKFPSMLVEPKESLYMVSCNFRLKRFEILGC